MQMLQEQQWEPEEDLYLQEARALRGANDAPLKRCKPGHEGHSHCTDDPDVPLSEGVEKELAICSEGHEGHSHCVDAVGATDIFDEFLAPADDAPLSADDAELIPRGDVLDIPEIEETKSQKKEEGKAMSICKAGHEGHSHCIDEGEVLPAEAAPKGTTHGKAKGKDKAKGDAEEKKEKDCDGSHAGHSHCDE